VSKYDFQAPPETLIVNGRRFELYESGLSYHMYGHRYPWDFYVSLAFLHPSRSEDLPWRAYVTFHGRVLDTELCANPAVALVKALSMLRKEQTKRRAEVRKQIAQSTKELKKLITLDENLRVELNARIPKRPPPPKTTQPST